MGVSIKSLKGKVKRPIRVAKVCLDGSLWAKHDELAEQLESARGQSSPTMGADPKVTELTKQLAKVEEDMRKAEVAIEFRGISSYELAALQARFPSEDKRLAWDINAGAAALIAASAVEPTTEEEARELLEELHFAATDKLIGTAWNATTGSTEVPTSAPASALIRS
ncbi:hypothetical protein [Geodermatophilus sp. DSM 45219]|uniref:hypothetical protein n=1 Tax=Geodermatophilus sp. DSM 45219 TaxID=1881103 RepID=UPI00088B11E5|nr:hypothetical protein [Geodermatophilus sp. DSM 45219]SDN79047.1 hypothetical protein SAMN05428965_1637 [Geodermatophilus sp. DSM 45219]